MMQRYIVFLCRVPGQNSHVIAVYLHGNPGGPIQESSHIAEVLTAAGIGVFRFNYRGLWGNEDDFNLTNALGDLDAALDYLTALKTVERFGLDQSTIFLVGNSVGTATALVGASGESRVAGVVSLVPCDHGYFGRELADPHSEIRDFLDVTTEALFGEGGPVEGGAAAFLNDLMDNSDAFSFVPIAEGLLDKKLLFLVGVDDTVCYAEDHFFPLYRRLRALDHPALEARVLGMDHGFQGVGPDSLMQITADRIVDSFPVRPREAGDSGRE